MIMALIFFMAGVFVLFLLFKGRVQVATSIPKHRFLLPLGLIKPRTRVLIVVKGIIFAET